MINRRPVSAQALFNEHSGQMAISSITLAELLHGAQKGNAPAIPEAEALAGVKSHPTLGEGKVYWVFESSLGPRNQCAGIE